VTRDGAGERFWASPVAVDSSEEESMADAPPPAPHNPIGSWMTNAPAAFVTIRPGKPLEPVVTITGLSETIISVG